MRSLSILMVLFLAIIVVSCSRESTAPNSAANGGMPETTMPAMVQQIVDGEVKKLIETSPDSPLRTDVNDPSLFSYDVYAVVYLWGHLTNADGGPSTTTDWTGMLTTTAVGYLEPVMALFFEEGQDSLVPTNANIHIAWVSFTESDFDGVVGLLFVDRDANYTDPGTLIFDTDPLWLELPIDELDLFYGYYPVDNVNAVAVHARRIWSNSCPGGFLEGEWVRDDLGGLTGSFNGLWLDDDSNPEGYFSGLFWTEEDGSRRFSGQLSGYDTDQVIADLSGHWEYDDPRLCPVCGSSHGLFRGRYINLDGTMGGTIRGTFGDYTQPPEENHLPLTGVWQQACQSVDVVGSDSPASK